MGVPMRTYTVAGPMSDSYMGQACSVPVMIPEEEDGGGRGGEGDGNGEDEL